MFQEAFQTTDRPVRIEPDGQAIFVDWHEPRHFTVEMATPFFARRFGSMKFSILTPKGCAHWDRNELTFSAPAERSSAPTADETEDFWLLYTARSSILFA